MFSDTSQLPSGDDTTGVLNIVDVELEEGELDDHHDSQMISQLISEGEDDDIDHTRSKFIFRDNIPPCGLFCSYHLYKPIFN